MKRGKFESLISVSRLKSIQVLMGLLFLYLLLMSLEIPLIFRTGLGQEPFEDDNSEITIHTLPIKTLNADEELSLKETPSYHSPDRKMGQFPEVSGLIFDNNAFDNVSKDEFSELHVSVRDAFVIGKKVFEEIESGKFQTQLVTPIQNGTESCPNSVSVNGLQFLENRNLMVMPCGLTLGSHITVVGRPSWAHPENDSKIALVKDDDDEESVLVSQFMLELQGLRSVDGEEPPRILHFNPRIKGDWSGRPIIELNTCYRMQWGSALRCEGWKSRADEEYVDGQVKCERWIRDGDDHLEESKATWWLKRLVGRTKKVEVDWPYPFAENKLFVLTLSAGLEGYHINVDGRHITSFPYRPGFTLEDATGIYINGDVSINAIVAASLPTSHLSFAPQQLLEMQTEWRAPPLTDGPVELFIGVLSAGSHFSERMAVRKSWFQHKAIKSGKVVARFFVALHSRKEVNVELMKEAKFFRDIVVVPYMDNYDLVVLKTIAICEYGVRTVGAKYIMKCDDDTFVRIDAVGLELRKVSRKTSLYIGNINYYHRPLRHGKWAVTYEEWPEEEYPPYANGPGYVMSSDIAQSIVSDFEKHKLRVYFFLNVASIFLAFVCRLLLEGVELPFDGRDEHYDRWKMSESFPLTVQLFKMEDVSVGMWVERFNSSTPVKYVHSLKFCQFGCFEGYYTAHYQSPRQMICLWRKLRDLGKAQCCNMR